jgi:hypothetical protein
VSASLTQVLQWAYWWNSTEVLPDDVKREQVVVDLNTDARSNEEEAALMARDKPPVTQP